MSDDDIDQDVEASDWDPEDAKLVFGDPVQNQMPYLERLPKWVPEYLACWGSKKPEGGRMTVAFAAEFAGTSPAAVRKLRERSPAFRRLEEVSRYAGAQWAQSYVDAGLRGLAPGVMEALADLVKERNPQAVLKALEWLRGKQSQVWNIDLSRLTNEQLDQLARGDDPFSVLIGSQE